MVNWRKLKKVDAHIHIVPDAVHQANPDADDVWVYADLQQYYDKMDSLGIEKAVIMPLNDPWLMSMETSVEAVHRNLSAMKQRYPGRFYAFGDIDPRNTPQASVEALRQAVDVYGLDGIKLHPNNTGIAIDADYNLPIFSFAQQRGIPVAIHCYPNSLQDPGSAARVASVLARYPELTAIVCHMGAHQWQALLPTQAFVDLSAILPDYLRTYGIQKTNEILRGFGPDRLLFASDYPDNRFLQPGEIYDTYLDALEKMDFTQQEAEQIAWGNIEKILHPQLHPKLSLIHI